MNARVIAMDLGASGGKCFAGRFDDNGFTLREIHRFSHEPVTLHVADASGRVEERAFWDDLFIYRNLVEGLRAYRREVGAEVDTVGIDTWGADGVLMNPDGVPLGPMYCYRDHRLDGMIDQVKARMDPARIYGITGVHFQPFNVSNQLLWFVQNRPGLLRPGVRYLPVPTLFSYYLGGVTAVDSSWASVTQLMDARKRTWSREILRALASRRASCRGSCARAPSWGRCGGGSRTPRAWVPRGSWRWGPTTRRAPSRPRPWAGPPMRSSSARAPGH
jgi:rhamnulokinase